MGVDAVVEVEETEQTELESEREAKETAGLFRAEL